jgi:hypothetical protein
MVYVGWFPFSILFVVCKMWPRLIFPRRASRAGRHSTSILLLEWIILLKGLQIFENMLARVIMWIILGKIMSLMCARHDCWSGIALLVHKFTIIDSEPQWHLQSLTCTKFKVLKKHPSGWDVNPDGLFYSITSSLRICRGPKLALSYQRWREEGDAGSDWQGDSDTNNSSFHPSSI